MKIFAGFGVVFVACLVMCFFSVLNQYYKAVARHEMLLEIYKNPKAKVVPNHRAKEFIEQKKLQVRHKRALKAADEAHKTLIKQTENVNKLQEQLMLNGQPMTFSAYVPPAIDEEALKTKNEYNYSLCESIDYQQPLLKPENGTKDEIRISREQFESMVAIAPQVSTLGVASHANQME